MSDQPFRWNLPEKVDHKGGLPMKSPLALALKAVGETLPVLAEVYVENSTKTLKVMAQGAVVHAQARRGGSHG